MGSKFKMKVSRVLKRQGVRKNRRRLDEGLRQQVREVLVARAEPASIPELKPVVNAFHSDMFAPLQEFRLKQG